jgi:hypothetical protein
MSEGGGCAYILLKCLDTKRWTGESVCSKWLGINEDLVKKNALKNFIKISENTYLN